MLAEEMPLQFGYGLDVDAFGKIGCTVKLTRVANIVFVTSASVESICRELITSLSFSCRLAARLLCLYKRTSRCCQRQLTHGRLAKPLPFLPL